MTIDVRGGDMTDRLIIAFGPGIPMKEIVCALWYYDKEQLEDIIAQADNDIAGACQRLITASKEADRRFGAGWRFVKTVHPDVPEKQLLDMDLECGKDGTVAYWLVPACKLRQVWTLLESESL